MARYKEAISYSQKALKMNPNWGGNENFKKAIVSCKKEIDMIKFPDKLRKLSQKQNDLGILAELLLLTFEYKETGLIFAGGIKETWGEDAKDKIDVKIYDAQARFERIKAKLKKINSAKGTLKEAIDYYLLATDQIINGIELITKAFYSKDYRGEDKKGAAMVNLSGMYFLDCLRLIRKALVKHKKHFGETADKHLKSYIEFYERLTNTKRK